MTAGNGAVMFKTYAGSAPEDVQKCTQGELGHSQIQIRTREVKYGQYRLPGWKSSEWGRIFAA
jgi:hypothetical protein